MVAAHEDRRAATALECAARGDEPGGSAPCVAGAYGGVSFPLPAAVARAAGPHGSGFTQVLPGGAVAGWRMESDGVLQERGDAGQNHDLAGVYGICESVVGCQGSGDDGSNLLLSFPQQDVWEATWAAQHSGGGRTCTRDEPQIEGAAAGNG